MQLEVNLWKLSCIYVYETRHTHTQKKLSKTFVQCKLSNEFVRSFAWVFSFFLPQSLTKILEDISCSVESNMHFFLCLVIHPMFNVFLLWGLRIPASWVYPGLLSKNLRWEMLWISFSRAECVLLREFSHALGCQWQVHDFSPDIYCCHCQPQFCPYPRTQSSF